MEDFKKQYVKSSNSLSFYLKAESGRTSHLLLVLVLATKLFMNIRISYYVYTVIVINR